MKRGTIYGKPYKCGDFVPGAKGTLADMEEAGAVEWVDAPVREPRKPAEPQNVITKNDRRRKAAVRS
jgi:hypothetical protein